jgi:hypothetical protein
MKIIHVPLEPVYATAVAWRPPPLVLATARASASVQPLRGWQIGQAFHELRSALWA